MRLNRNHPDKERGARYINDGYRACLTNCMRNHCYSQVFWFIRAKMGRNGEFCANCWKIVQVLTLSSTKLSPLSSLIIGELLLVRTHFEWEGKLIFIGRAIEFKKKNAQFARSNTSYNNNSWYSTKNYDENFSSPQCARSQDRLLCRRRRMRDAWRLDGSFYFRLKCVVLLVLLPLSSFDRQMLRHTMYQSTNRIESHYISHIDKTNESDFRVYARDNNICG